MEKEIEQIDVRSASINLTDYSIISQNVEAVTKNDEPALRRTDIKVELLNHIWLETEEGEPSRITSNVSIEVDPDEKSNFYKCSINIAGLFVVTDNSQDRDAVEYYIATRGAQELYDIARVHLFQATANGMFGPLMLPSICIEAVNR